jgi:hypothetical protein
MVKGFEQMPATTAEEQETRKDQIAEFKKNNEAILTRYKNELNETASQGLLEAPAIIPLTIYNTDENTPIFTEEDKGFMIVRANPGYMRKDLPRYIPQLFVMFWHWNEFKPQADVGKLIEQKFPLGQLLEMIDK